MVKKIPKIKVILIITMAFTVMGIFMACSSETLEVDSFTSGEATFIYGSNNSISKISKEDLETIKNIIGNKVLYSDNPSCGFSTDVSLRFNDEKTFCIAWDGCPTLLYKEENKYLSLNEEEYEELVDILKKYGISFPCV